MATLDTVPLLNERFSSKDEALSAVKRACFAAGRKFCVYYSDRQTLRVRCATLPVTVPRRRRETNASCSGDEENKFATEDACDAESSSCDSSVSSQQESDTPTAATSPSCSFKGVFLLEPTEAVSDKPWLCVQWLGDHTCSAMPARARARRHAFDYKEFVPLVETELRAHRKVSGPSVMFLICKAFTGIEISRAMAYRVIEAAKKRVNGDPVQAFKRFKAWARRFSEADPDSIGVVETRPDHVDGVEVQRYERCFFMHGHARRMYQHLPPVVALDAAHCEDGNLLLDAMAMDQNHKLVLVAFGHVPRENADNWRWFLTKLKTAVPALASREQVFLTDMDKGLETVVDELFSPARHYWCAFHMHDNLKLHVNRSIGCANWNKKLVKDLFDKIRLAKTLQGFDRGMQEMRQRCEPAWQYLQQHDMKKWAVCTASSTMFGVTASSWCESFHATMKRQGIRAMVVPFMMRAIDEWFTQRLLERCNALFTANGDPQTAIILEKFTNGTEPAGRSYIAHSVNVSNQSGIVHDRQENGTEEVAHEVSAKTYDGCSCNEGYFTGIPCKHVVAVANKLDFLSNLVKKAIDTIHPALTAANYRAAYEAAGNPRAAPWNDLDLEEEPVFHHEVRRSRGRPRKVKRKPSRGEASDLAMTSNGRRRRAKTCSQCGKSDHTKPRCPKIARTNISRHVSQHASQG